mmetsp:Transcript_12871/g.27428  ORF Transcript_12871/g.27428 Transcript_12871/m.27428 type:complete len:99 (-) Transcript_12871:92-388(-)
MYDDGTSDSAKVNNWAFIVKQLMSSLLRSSEIYCQPAVPAVQRIYLPNAVRCQQFCNAFSMQSALTTVCSANRTQLPLYRFDKAHVVYSCILPCIAEH